VRSRRALYLECLFVSPQDRLTERHIKVLFLPLTEDGECVNQVLVAQVFLYLDPVARQRHFLEARPFKEITHTLL